MLDVAIIRLINMPPSISTLPITLLSNRSRRGKIGSGAMWTTWQWNLDEFYTNQITEQSALDSGVNPTVWELKDMFLVGG
jgi:hypothetical protein